MEITSVIHSFFSPRKIHFGVDATKSIGAEAKILGGSKALIVTDAGVMKSGLVERIGPHLESAGIPHVVFNKVQPDPPVRVVEECTDLIRDEQADIVIGLGGGSALDVAKAASLMAVNRGTIVDYSGMDLVPKRGLPKILVPTTAGTGSEATRVIIVADERLQLKRAIYSDYALADVAIVDPVLTSSMPPGVTADTGLDALAHAIETFVAKTATPFSHVLALEAIRLISRNLPDAYEKGDCLEARRGMSLGALLAGLAFGSGGLGAVHALAYPLGSEYHLTHGRSVAAILPQVMSYNLVADPDRYAEIGAAMGADVAGLGPSEQGEAAVTQVRRLLDQVKVSARLRDHGVSQEDIPMLVQEGMKFSRLFVPNPRNLTAEDVEGIYREAW